MGSKRANGEGTVRKRKDGRWEGRVVIGYDEKGNPKTKSVLAHTKGECLEKLEKLKEECKEKDKIINSIEPLREEMAENVKEHKRLKNEYEKSVEELKLMKEIINETVYKGRWKIIKFLIKK